MTTEAPPHIEWGILLPHRSAFVLELLEFLNDGVEASRDVGRQAKFRVYTARDRLPRILGLADKNIDWDVFGDSGFETFRTGISKRLQDIVRAEIHDDLLGASYAVVLCEGRFFSLFNEVTGYSFFERWRQGREPRLGDQTLLELDDWILANVKEARKHQQSVSQ